jgi:hypothetical protein
MDRQHLSSPHRQPYGTEVGTRTELNPAKGDGGLDLSLSHFLRMVHGWCSEAPGELAFRPDCNHMIFESNFTTGFSSKNGVRSDMFQRELFEEFMLLSFQCEFLHSNAVRILSRVSFRTEDSKKFRPYQRSPEAFYSSSDCSPQLSVTLPSS